MSVSDRYPPLIIEILSGPLDGATIEIHEASNWTGSGTGPLSFPWDAELGDPQARFVPGSDGWILECFEARHATYRVNENQLVKGSIQLCSRDVLKANTTWLLVRSA